MSQIYVTTAHPVSRGPGDSHLYTPSFVHRYTLHSMSVVTSLTPHLVFRGKLYFPKKLNPGAESALPGVFYFAFFLLNFLKEDNFHYPSETEEGKIIIKQEEKT